MQSVFKALSDPTRRRILTLLKEREMTAGELAEHFDLSKPTLSRHFAILREAELVRAERTGNHRIYRLNASVAEDALRNLLQALGIGSGEATRYDGDMDND